MCTLNFEYHAQNVPEKLRLDFEERVNKNYASVCKLINQSGSNVIVSWKDEHTTLRGIIALDEEILKVLKLNKLDDKFE